MAARNPAPANLFASTPHTPTDTHPPPHPHPRCRSYTFQVWQDTAVGRQKMVRDGLETTLTLVPGGAAGVKAAAAAEAAAGTPGSSTAAGRLAVCSLQAHTGACARIHPDLLLF